MKLTGKLLYPALFMSIFAQAGEGPAAAAAAAAFVPRAAAGESKEGAEASDNRPKAEKVYAPDQQIQNETLIAAVKANDSNAAENALDAGADINYKDPKTKSTPLLIGCNNFETTHHDPAQYEKNFETVKLLLSHRSSYQNPINLNAVNCWDTTALTTCIFLRVQDFISLILYYSQLHGAPIDVTIKDSMHRKNILLYYIDTFCSSCEDFDRSNIKNLMQLIAKMPISEPIDLSSEPRPGTSLLSVVQPDLAALILARPSSTPGHWLTRIDLAETLMPINYDCIKLLISILIADLMQGHTIEANITNFCTETLRLRGLRANSARRAKIHAKVSRLFTATQALIDAYQAVKTKKSSTSNIAAYQIEQTEFDRAKADFERNLTSQDKHNRDAILLARTSYKNYIGFLIAKDQDLFRDQIKNNPFHIRRRQLYEEYVNQLNIIDKEIAESETPDPEDLAFRQKLSNRIDRFSRDLGRDKASLLDLPKKANIFRAITGQSIGEHRFRTRHDFHVPAPHRPMVNCLTKQQIRDRRKNYLTTANCTHMIMQSRLHQNYRLQ